MRVRLTHHSGSWDGDSQSVHAAVSSLHNTMWGKSCRVVSRTPAAVLPRTHADLWILDDPTSVDHCWCDGLLLFYKGWQDIFQNVWEWHKTFRYYHCHCFHQSLVHDANSFFLTIPSSKKLTIAHSSVKGVFILVEFHQKSLQLLIAVSSFWWNFTEFCEFHLVMLM